MITNGIKIGTLQNMKSTRPLITLRLLKITPILFIPLILFPHTSFGTDLKPDYSNPYDVNPILLQHNYSPLNADRYSFSLVNKSQIINTKDTNTLSQEYLDLNRDYEFRKNQGILDPQEEQTHDGQVSGFSQHVVDKLEQKQMDDEGKRVQPTLTSLEKDFRNEKSLAPVAAVGGTAVMLYTGHSFDVWTQKQDKISAMANARTQCGQVQYRTPAFSTAFDFQMAAPGSRDATTVFSDNPLARGDEKIRVSISKPISKLGINTDLSYRSTSRILTSTFSKDVVPHVTLSLESAYPMDPDNSDIKSAGGAVKAAYKIQF